jgi:hypothetical protein
MPSRDLIRSHYERALQELEGWEHPAPEWTYGAQPVPRTSREQLSGAVNLAVGIGLVALAGESRLGQGRLGWDPIVQGIRAGEEFSPGRVFRTFQLSHLLSPLESASRQTRYWSPELLQEFRQQGRAAPANRWLDILERQVGDFQITTKGRGDTRITRTVQLTSPDVIERGFRYEGGQILLGEKSKQVLLKDAYIFRNPAGAIPHLEQGYVRSLFGGPVEGLKSTLTYRVPFITSAGTEAAESFLIGGGHSKAGAAWRYSAGYGTSLVERINRLARAPFELGPVSDLMEKLPGWAKPNLALKQPTSGLKTLLKTTGKIGIALPAMYAAYQYVDYAARNMSMLDSTLLGEGITAAAATVWTRGQLMASSLAEVTGMHALRERQEMFAPGSTELSKLAAFPILGGLGGIGLGYANRVVQQGKLMTQGHSLIEATQIQELTSTFFSRHLYEKGIDRAIEQSVAPDIIDAARRKAAEKLEGTFGKVITSLTAEQRGKGVGSWIARLAGSPSPAKIAGLAGMAIGAAAVLPFVPGALVPGERPDELEDLYSGKKKVAIRKGRWWEFGRSPYEGERIDRYREHWYPRLLARARDKGIYGEEEVSPFGKFWLENFTYELEKEHYYDRPYPVSGAAFEDVPFIGPLLGATVGRIVKPPVMMHTDIWQAHEAGVLEAEVQGKMQELPADAVLRQPLRYGERGEIAALGEQQVGAPVSPYDLKGVLGETAYRMTEMVGLPGFTETAIKQRVLGTPDWFDQEMQLESARRMYGAERAYWDLEIGGGLGTTELVRRLYPHRRRQIELYNPIPNLMPSWMPGEGDRSANFQVGDPYVKVVEGETRLPGRAYEALNPELEGVHPEQYPLMHRFSILADVAPYSQKFQDISSEVRKAKKYGQLSENDVSTYKEVLGQLQSRKARKEFSPYMYRDRLMNPAEEALAEFNEGKKKDTPTPTMFEKIMGSYWETIAHGAQTPLEFATPVSPASKLIHMRTAVEDYEQTQVYGTKNAFWQHPVKDFLTPMWESTKHAAGWDGIPDSVQRRRDVEQYFDILKYVKYTRLENAARRKDDYNAADVFYQKRRETVTGVDPFTFNFSHVYRALPRSERDYFAEFAKADIEERADIITMIPDNEKSLYIARWRLADVKSYTQAREKGLLDDDEIETANRLEQQLLEDRKTEGFPVNDTLWEEYIKTRHGNESYADWYRRTKLIPQQLEDKPLPGPDWVGWDPRVELTDIKMKVVENMGESLFDYDIWPQQQKAAARRPYLAEASDPVIEGSALSQQEVRSRVLQVLKANELEDIRISVFPRYGKRDHQIELSIEEDRTSEAMLRINKEGLN